MRRVASDDVLEPPSCCCVDTCWLHAASKLSWLRSSTVGLPSTVCIFNTWLGIRTPWVHVNYASVLDMTKFACTCCSSCCLIRCYHSPRIEQGWIPTSVVNFSLEVR
jgi:hypothetical protein